jgi:hypothetical protein
MAIRALFPIALIASSLAAASAFDGEKREALYEVTLYMDNDGKMDRAALVGSSGGGYVDLYIYLAAGDEKLDLSRQPDFLKKEITDGSIFEGALESKGSGSLTVTSCYGCGAHKSSDETLTIAHRGGEFLVAGYTRNWDWNSEVQKADGSWDIETLMGGCDINFLTGKGVASQSLDESHPIKGTFKPIELADWSEDKRPKACEF